LEDTPFYHVAAQPGDSETFETPAAYVDLRALSELVRSLALVPLHGDAEPQERRPSYERVQSLVSTQFK
jgi:hypothetical protein